MEKIILILSFILPEREQFGEAADIGGRRDQGEVPKDWPHSPLHLEHLTSEALKIHRDWARGSETFQENFLVAGRCA